jgi:hypothetical protein
MNFVEKLQDHIGGLIRLKSDLYYMTTRSWRFPVTNVYLLLDAFPPIAQDPCSRPSIKIICKNIHVNVL